MQKIPPIKRVMTPFPYSIDIDETLAAARNMMDDHRIHHLPVTEDHQLVGVVNIDEVRDGADRNGGTSIRKVIRRNAYVVDLNEALDKVLGAMAEQHLSSVLVTRKGRLAGLFTGTDACRTFAEYLHRDFPAGGDDAA